MPVSRYRYVGPPELRRLIGQPSDRCCIQDEASLEKWLRQTQPLRGGQAITGTFIIDLNEQLWIADRHSEHVVCAAGEDVLAAGEMTFAQRAQGIVVIEATNQSTGYCPEPACWPVVDRVLSRLRIPHPPCFTSEIILRRCTTCGTTNIVKDDIFECTVCGAELSETWNF